MTMADPYDRDFYSRQVDGSLASARLLLGHLFAHWLPQCVIDIGCGRGAWLAACGEHGVGRLAGVDGDWVRQDMMLDPKIAFRSANLQEGFAPEAAFDLAISLEVAEHLQPNASDRFVETLAAHSGAILFSAAFIGQPGRNHINTQPHSFWARKFIDRGFALFDLFRPRFWGNNDVEPWYRQNTFLYVRGDHPLSEALGLSGERPIEALGFVDCVHPWLYLGMLEELNRLQAMLVLRSEGGSAEPAAKVGRNDLCPCGSGKKYKHCHGA